MTPTLSEKINIKLSKWYKLNHRELPWRLTKDPYHIWMSEIILQQTRVAQGTSYYLKFSENYPTVKDFAKAPLDEILKLWQGLGYYSRARNMHKCANIITHEMSGKFPDNYIELQKLIGIGKYTAAAIASICFNDPVPAIDGNAFRVYSRLFEIHSDIALSATFKEFFNLGLNLIPESSPGDFNQAVMELGATVCVPKKPKCPACPLNEICLAFDKKLQNALPVKSKNIKVKKRYFDYILFLHEDKILVNKRSGKDIWLELFDFLLVESDNTPKSSIFETLKKDEWGELKLLGSSEEYKHILTHQRLFIRFHVVKVDLHKDFELICQNNKLKAIHLSDLENLAVPKPIEHFLEHEFSEML